EDTAPAVSSVPVAAAAPGAPSPAAMPAAADGQRPADGSPAPERAAEASGTTAEARDAGGAQRPATAPLAAATEDLDAWDADGWDTDDAWDLDAGDTDAGDLDGWDTDAGARSSPAADDEPAEDRPASGGRVPDGQALMGGRRSRPAATPVVGRRPTPAWAGVASLDGHPDAPVRVARCCLPLPGDELIGFVAQHSAVTLHRGECANAQPSGSAREPLRVLHWDAPSEHAFPAEIAVEAFDRYGLLADITEVLSDTAAGLRAASTSTSEDRVAHARFTVEVTGPEQLDTVLTAVRTVGGVYDCYRACQTGS
ncbi:ACT domain-containing protein, partial [Frankia nepalensis]|uniref:ACT domain-containing protein n=1 Tax=Frankia nepalensis TaxID=1836974 RepID=UPI001EE3EA26